MTQLQSVRIDANFLAHVLAVSALALVVAIVLGVASPAHATNAALSSVITSQDQGVR